MFRSVILCGYGKNLYPLIESNSISTSLNDNSTIGIGATGETDQSTGAGAGGNKSEQIKSLLSIVGDSNSSNKKIIDFILNKLEESGLNDVLILTPTSIAPPLTQHIKQRRNAASSLTAANFSSFPSPSTSAASINTPKLEVQEVPDNFAKRGTVDVLRWAIDKGLIKTDFIVFPCDLLLIPNTASPTSTTTPINMSISKLINEHIIANTLITTLLYERESGNVVDAAKDGPSEILTIYDKKSSSLLDLREMEEYLTDDEIPISTRLLSQYPTPTLSLNLLPTHVYIFSAAVLPYLTSPSLSIPSTSPNSSSPNPTQRLQDHEAKELSSIRTRVKRSENFLELVGYFSRLSWKKRHSHSHDYSPTNNSLDLANSELMGSSSTTTGFKRPSLISRRTSYAGNGALEDDDESSGAKVEMRGPYDGVKVLVWKAKDGFCARGNTVQGWVELNRAALKLLPPLTTPMPIGISADSYLHPALLSSTNHTGGVHNFGERVGIKRSIILSKNCFIARGAKLTGVIVMDGVRIGENVKLENCILSNNVQIRDRAILKDCDLGRGVIVLADASLKNEQLVLELD